MNDAHITIKNVGPIKNVDISLNQINVFMGPQSSGKSTIAKIISYCSWLEKHVLLQNRIEKTLKKHLIEFHNLDENYFSKDTYIKYETFHCKIEYSGKTPETTTASLRSESNFVFRNRKIEYIPAERNLVAIPGFQQYNKEQDNVLNFMNDWMEAKQELIKSNKFLLPISTLSGVSYYYDKEANIDYILLEDGNSITLRHASSGLMSVTPLLILFDYIIQRIYLKEVFFTPFQRIQIKDKIATINSVQDQKLYESMFEAIDKLGSGSNASSEDIKKYQDALCKLIGFDTQYNFSEIIIEEPELNLFPETQQKLVYYLLESICSSIRPHQLVLTTHSPYILFSMNNCMMGGLVKDSIPEDKRNEFESCHSWIDPKKVSIYEIHNGELKPIQDEDGIIEDNYLNQAYKENSAEYLSLLNYFDNEE